jgi:hypothetical protein
LNDAGGRRTNCNRKHGTWYYRYDLPRDSQGRRRQVKQGRFATEREARKALTQALSGLDRGVHVERSRVLVDDFLDQWLDGRVHLRPSCIRFYRVAVDRYVKPELGCTRLPELQADDIDRAFARIRQGVDGRGRPVSLPSSAVSRRRCALPSTWRSIAVWCTSTPSSTSRWWPMQGQRRTSGTP